MTNQAAVAVIGQKNFSDNTAGATLDMIGSPAGLALAGNQLIVCDGFVPFSAPNNNRILIYSNFPALTAGQAASVVIGQPDFITTTPGLSQTGLHSPAGIGADGRRLAIADVMNNRVVLFNQIPTTNGAPADVVVGQGNFTTNVPGTSATGLRGPQGVFIDGQRFMVADTFNHRVLLFNSVPTANGAKADVVLGQADFNVNADVFATATTMRSPTSVFWDGRHLIVTDLGHNRVMIWNRLPASNNTPADVIVGQPDFTTEAVGVSPTTLNFPRYAVSDGTRLFISDTGNNRVLVYNTFPTTNGAAPDVVIGQRDFFAFTDPDQADPQRLTAAMLAQPGALVANSSSLFVADTADRRVLRYAPGITGLFSPGQVLNAASFGGNGLARPQNVQVAVEPDDTSTLPAAAYFIKVAAEGGILFESTPSQEVSVTVPEKSKLVVTFDEVQNATSYRAYLGMSPGGQRLEYDTVSPASGQPIDRTITINTLGAFQGQPPQLEITPGGIQALFGSDLSSDTITSQTIPLPTELNGLSVLVNNIPAPLFFVSPNQINFQTPWEVQGSSSSVVVRKTSPGGNVTLSTAVEVKVTNENAGLFTKSGDGTGELLAFHSDFTLVDQDHPVAPGETIIFFATGVQDVSMIPPTGAASSVSNINTTQSVTIGDFGTTLLYAGLAPGFVGVLQFNAQVPNDLPATGALTLVKVIIGAIPANSAFVWVAKPFGTLTVGPAPDFTVTWSVNGFPSAQVSVAGVDGVETVFSSGATGSSPASFIQPGGFYQFILRSIDASGTVGDILATVTIDLR